MFHHATLPPPGLTTNLFPTSHPAPPSNTQHDVTLVIHVQSIPSISHCSRANSASPVPRIPRANRPYARISYLISRLHAGYCSTKTAPCQACSPKHVYPARIVSNPCVGRLICRALCDPGCGTWCWHEVLRAWEACEKGR
jgi:hypothetical protein